MLTTSEPVFPDCATDRVRGSCNRGASSLQLDMYQEMLLQQGPGGFYSWFLRRGACVVVMGVEGNDPQVDGGRHQLKGFRLDRL